MLSKDCDGMISNLEWITSLWARKEILEIFVLCCNLECFEYKESYCV